MHTNAKVPKRRTFSDAGVFRELRFATQGAALRTRKLLKKFDQNFYADNVQLEFTLTGSSERRR